MKFKPTPKQERSEAIFGRFDRLEVFSAIAGQDGHEIDAPAIAADTSVHISEVREVVRDLASAGVLVEEPRGHYHRNVEVDWSKLEAALDEISRLDPKPGRPTRSD